MCACGNTTSRGAGSEKPEAYDAGSGGNPSTEGDGGAAGSSEEEVPWICAEPRPSDDDPACPEGWSLVTDSVCGQESCMQLRRCVVRCTSDDDCPRCLPGCGILHAWEGDACYSDGLFLAEVCGVGGFCL